MSDRYLRIVLTIIALELGWIGLKDTAIHVSAQQQPQQQQQVTPVVIRGIELPCEGNALNCRETMLPVAIARSSVPVRITADSPLAVDARGIVRIRADQPVLVETGDRPLLIESVPPRTAPRPGVPN